MSTTIDAASSAAWRTAVLDALHAAGEPVPPVDLIIATGLGRPAVLHALDALDLTPDDRGRYATATTTGHGLGIEATTAQWVRALADNGERRWETDAKSLPVITTENVIKFLGMVVRAGGVITDGVPQSVQAVGRRVAKNATDVGLYPTDWPGRVRKTVRAWLPSELSPWSPSAAMRDLVDRIAADRNQRQTTRAASREAEKERLRERDGYEVAARLRPHLTAGTSLPSSAVARFVWPDQWQASMALLDPKEQVDEQHRIRRDTIILLDHLTGVMPGLVYDRAMQTVRLVD